MAPFDVPYGAPAAGPPSYLPYEITLATIMDRCDQPPVQETFTEIGSYRFLTG